MTYFVLDDDRICEYAYERISYGAPNIIFILGERVRDTWHKNKPVRSRTVSKTSISQQPFRLSTYTMIYLVQCLSLQVFATDLLKAKINSMWWKLWKHFQFQIPFGGHENLNRGRCSVCHRIWYTKQMRLINLRFWTINSIDSLEPRSWFHRSIECVSFPNGILYFHWVCLILSLFGKIFQQFFSYRRWHRFVSSNFDNSHNV